MVLYFWDLLIYQCERQLNFGKIKNDATMQFNDIKSVACDKHGNPPFSNIKYLIKIT